MASIWIEICGSWIRVKILYLFRQIFENFNFLGNFTQKIRFFTGKFSKYFDFSGNFTKNFEIPGKNWSFTATSGQTILFLSKRQHFRTYVLYMISYRPNNISRPPRLPCPKYGGSRPPIPQD